MKKIKLIYWNAPNFGDLLSPYIVEKLSSAKIEYKYKGKRWYTEFLRRLIDFDFKSLRHILKPWDNTLIAVGSVIAWGNKKSQVWGSGLLRATENVEVGHIYAVRGKYTREVLINKGYNVPEVYGDPAILLPLIYRPKSTNNNYNIGIIPNWEEFEYFFDKYHEQFKIIDLRSKDIEDVINQIYSCNYILSTSLHGLIVAHTYGIKAIWIKKGDIQTDGIKFKDYFDSVKIRIYKPFTNYNTILEYKENIPSFFKENNDISLPDMEYLKKVRSNLLSVAPFRVKNNLSL